MIHFLPLLFAAAPQTAAQDGAYSRDQLELTTYTPRWIDAGELYVSMDGMFGRQLQVEDRCVANLNLLYDSILIYDTPAECKRLVAALTALEQRYEQATAEIEGRSDLPLLRDVPVLDLRLRAMSVDGAMQALDLYYRDVNARDDAGNTISFRNVEVMEDGLLLLRDTPENLDAMRGLIDRLDQPPPRVSVSAWVLQGGGEAGAAQLPPQLAKDLGGLLPGMGFESVSRGMLQAAAVSGRVVNLSMRSGSGTRYDLSLATGSYDAAAGLFTLQRCEFSSWSAEGGTENLFETSTVLRKGEYAVIGLTGADPVLLVLRMDPLP
jgi:hypothetical protein